MSDVKTDLQTALTEALAAHGVTGASLAVWDGTRLETAVAGVRNSATGDPVTLDTLMHVGSITKVFNATLVLQLIDDGLAGLDDLVAAHLPDLELGEPAALGSITIRMLLNHTSGINGMILPDHGPDLERIEDAVLRVKDLDQIHAPGAGPSYCNIGVVLAGYLAQRLRGASWYALVKERILRPLGLTHALVDLTEIPLYRVSVGDVTDPSTGKRVQTTRPFLPVSFAPAGATMMMTAEDLVGFGRAHLNGGVGANGARILSEASARLMQAPTADVLEPDILKWGLGWQILPGGLLGHGGGGPGVASQFYLHPESGRALALLTNSDTGGALSSALVHPILSAWTSGAYPAAPTAAEPGPLDVAPYLGAFANNAMRFEFVEHGGGLGVRMVNIAKFYDNTVTELSPPMGLEPLGGRAFGLGAQSVRFLPADETGLSPGLGVNCLYLRRVPPSAQV